MSSSLSHVSDQDRYVKSQILAAASLQMGECETHSETTSHIPTAACAKLSGNEANPIIRLLRSNEKAPVFPGLFRLIASKSEAEVPPAEAEQLQDSAGKSQVFDSGDSLSDSHRRISDVRLAKLVENWTTLPDAVQNEILALAEISWEENSNIDDQKTVKDGEAISG